MAVSAEQDNRVRIPNGTAAVKLEGHDLVKTGHWKQFREGCRVQGKHLPGRLSQKTYGHGFFTIPYALWGVYCRGKPAVAPKLGATVF